MSAVLLEPEPSSRSFQVRHIPSLQHHHLSQHTINKHVSFMQLLTNPLRMGTLTFRDCVPGAAMFD
jgi:hypothetical protein